MKKIYFIFMMLLAVANSAFSQITSTASGGNWSNTATWVGGVVPGGSDDVIIADGATVTINTDASALSVTVGQGTSGILQFEQATARTLTVGGNVTVAAGATFRSSLAGTQTGHLLTLTGSVTNNGTLDFSTNGNTASALVEFTGTNSVTFGGTGPITDIAEITIDKGTTQTPVVELNPTNFTFKGNSITPGNGDNAFLNLLNGTFKIGGTFVAANGLFTNAPTTSDYTIPASAKLWLANPNYTVVARTGSASVNGALQIDAGTLNIGTQDANRLFYQTGTFITINGGTINLASRMTSPAGFGLTYTQTGGTFNVCTVANSSTGFASFHMPGPDGALFTMSGGNIIIVNPNSSGTGPRDFLLPLGAPEINITGGTVQFGNALTPPGSAFFAQGQFPDLVVDNANGGNSLTLLGNATVNQNTNIKTGSSLTTSGFTYRQNGPVFTNSGTFDGSSAGTVLIFPAATTQTLNGDGVFTAPLNQLIVNNGGGLSIANSLPSEIVVNTLSMANGNINTGVTTLTLGTSTANTGTFNYTFGTIVGKFKRWINAATGTRDFPIGTSVSFRNASINFTTAPTAGGTLTAEWVNGAGGTNGLPLVEGSINVNRSSSVGYWSIVAGDGLTGGVYTGTFTGTSLGGITDYTQLVLIKRANSAAPWTLNGTHVTTTGDNTIPILSRTNMSGFSEFSAGGDVAVNPLPIKIEYFSGRKQSSNNLLDWKINCSSTTGVSMTLQRSSDGRNFEAINTQEASSLRCLQPFDYTDVTATTATSYYRLKVVDVDGKITYSPIVAILNKDKGFELVSLMPNVISARTILNVSSSIATRMQIVVTDISGKVVNRQSVSLIAGSNLVPLNFGGLSAGSYNLSTYTAEGQLKTTRFVKQ
ncbi:T9SS type A sorting domain-containing protein [Ferruginibacter sp. HRS2-29]|uniref:beta strand repeat-containing protein n=1 Tax=Ferruginibacter sp. HRS2-29 TaxID=2487334 RepID=UPI0020CC0DD5|nr:T9SS type A sorting domain-containing protein [Ferruginibacter sp. HRS2-29]MCP9749472.1 T9SS C-terminal target domain-containing protein [Ferruginibacter sp. HRS2-29]